MNKMVIMDIDKTYAICMKNNGTVCRVRNKNYYIGEEIIMNKSIKQTFRRLSYAFIAMIVLAAGSAYAAVKIPYEYVSLDVNPSVQYTVNIFGNVISVEGVNQDGEAVLKNIDIDNIEGQNIETALAQTLIQIARDGYVSTIEDPIVVVATSSNDDEENLVLVQKVNDEISYILNNVQEDSQSGENQEGEESDEGQEDLEEPKEDKDTDENVDELLENVEVEVVGVGRERVLEARELGISPGKLNLIEKYIEASGDEDVDILEWSEKSVKEIQKATHLAKGIGNNGDNECETNEELGEVEEGYDINGTEYEDNDDVLDEDESDDDKDDSDIEDEDKSDVKKEDKGKLGNNGNGNSESNGKSSSGSNNSSNNSNGNSSSSSSNNGNSNSSSNGNGNSGNNGKNK